MTKKKTTKKKTEKPKPLSAHDLRRIRHLKKRGA